LKLESHGEANHEQDGKYNPAIAQRLTPIEVGATSGGAMRLSTAQHVRAAAHIGSAARFT
jgi:hypothetical protein